MLDIKNLTFAISQISNGGAESFLKSHSLFQSSDVEGVYHYQSLLPSFDKFIYFDFKSKKISLVFSDKEIYFSEIFENFTILESNYSYRDDISRIKISDSVYITVDGKLDDTENPTSFTDAKGNIKYLDETQVKAVVIELH